MKYPLKKIGLVFLLFAIPFLGMAQVLVSYNKASKTDFKKYKTYQVYGLNVTTIPEFEPKKESINFLIAEIGKQMVARGYQKVNESCCFNPSRNSGSKGSGKYLRLVRPALRNELTAKRGTSG